jgi:cysteine desulfurase
LKIEDATTSGFIARIALARGSSYYNLRMDVIYLDNNATTQPAPEVVQAMVPFLSEMYGNPSSVHRMGQRARQAVDEARAKVATLLGCADAELMFTGGGTEAINTAVRGLVAARSPRKRIVTTTVEHSATRELCVQLQKEGFEIVWLDVDREGHLDIDRLKQVVDDSVALVSIMWANNETGVIFPVERIVEICRSASVPFHCDATQAVGKIPVDLKTATNFTAPRESA